MPDYRLYTVDKGGHVMEAPQVVTCPSDEEAVAKARSMVNGLDLEVWDGARVVAEIASAE
jgi:hypothetical protein